MEKSADRMLIAKCDKGGVKDNVSFNREKRRVSQIPWFILVGLGFQLKRRRLDSVSDGQGRCTRVTDTQKEKEEGRDRTKSVFWSFL